MLTSTFIFLKGIGESTERQLWNHGILDWNSFIQAPALPGISRARKDLYDQELSEALHQHHQGNSQFFAQRLKPRDHWRLFHTFRDRTMFLDIETTGGSIGMDSITVVGMSINGTMTTLIAKDTLTEARMCEEFTKADLLVTFYGTGFDLPCLRTSFPRLLLNHAHFDLCFAARRMGLRGGLKHIEHTLGLTRSSGIDGLSGWDAVTLWNAWQCGDIQAGQRLCQYNEADVQNLEPLAHHIYSHFVERYGPPLGACPR